MPRARTLSLSRSARPNRRTPHGYAYMRVIYIYIYIYTYIYIHIYILYMLAFTRSRGSARSRRWRRVTSVPLLSDRAIEKFPRFFAHGHPGGASRVLIGPAVWSSLRAAGARRGGWTRSPSLPFSRPPPASLSLSLSLSVLPARTASSPGICLGYRY